MHFGGYDHSPIFHLHLLAHIAKNSILLISVGLWQTARPSLNLRFQVGICPEKFRFNQIQNDRLSALINVNMPDIWQTVPDSQTISTV